MKKLAAVSFALLATQPRVAIKTSPAVLFAGNGVTVICTVPRSAENRKVTAEVVNYTSSERQLEGENSPVTFRFEFKHVPCETVGAVCTVTDNLGGQVSAAAPILVQGCETP